MGIKRKIIPRKRVKEEAEVYIRRPIPREDWSPIDAPAPHPPAYYGLPPKFRSWRPYQWAAVSEIVSTKGFLGQVNPTGIGKSIIYTAASKILNLKTVILTSTKALQSQLHSDFGSIGAKIVMGQNNYVCLDDRSTSCDGGVCHVGVPCDLKGGGCLYYDSLRVAKNSKLMVTNYHYWMLAGDPKEVGLLVLDEAHHAPFILLDFMTLSFDVREYVDLFGQEVPYHGDDSDAWALTGEHFLELCKELKDGFKQKIESQPDQREYRLLARRVLHAERLFDALSLVEGKWVGEIKDHKVTLTPTKPSRNMAHKLLFRGVGRVLLTSATLTRKTLEMLGLGEEDYTFSEYPSTIPKSARRVFHVNTCMVNFRTPAHVLRAQWLTRIDQIIDMWGKVGKGIIHTGSHQRKDLIVNESRHKAIMFYNATKDIKTVVEAFKKAPPPAILVSPSLVAGYDFPHDQCRFQIITKIPFPDARGAVWDLRKDLDPEIIDYITLQSLIQSSGRGSRAEDDFCVTFVVDDSMWWWWPRVKDNAPKWFSEAYMSVPVIPRVKDLLPVNGGLR